MSNIDAFSASLDHHLNILDFTRDGLGERLLDQEARRIAERAANQRGPQVRWRRNQGEYGKEKRKRGIPVGVGLRPDGDPMLSGGNLHGDREITPNEATMHFGTSEAARRKGEWFSNGSFGTDGEKSGAHGQPARPFYEMNQGDRKAIRDECDNAVSRHLKG